VTSHRRRAIRRLGTVVLALLAYSPLGLFNGQAQTLTPAPADGAPMVRVVLAADLASVPEQEQATRLQAVVPILVRRLQGLGVSEPRVEVVGSNRVLVEFGGPDRGDEITTLLTTPARLEFRQQLQRSDGTSDWIPAVARDSTGLERALTGAYFEGVAFGSVSTSNQPVITFALNDEGRQMLAELTGRLVGQPLGVFVDDRLLTAPIVREQITGGRGQITGRLTAEEGRQLAAQLQGGPLPVPLVVVDAP
jgi:protein-export membrane protein SecD